MNGTNRHMPMLVKKLASCISSVSIPKAPDISLRLLR